MTHYIEPKPDTCEMRIIKTPCVVAHIDEIDPTYCTQEDAKVKECPKCGGNTIHATLRASDNCTVSHWWCLCGWRWDTDRGIIVRPVEQQLLMFVEARG